MSLEDRKPFPEVISGPDDALKQTQRRIAVNGLSRVVRREGAR